MVKRELKLTCFLRIVGSVSMLALLFIAVPYAWMNNIHQQLGLGILPDTAITGYLTRSLSAFYVFLGALFWVLSFDISKYRAIIRFVGIAIVMFGIVMFGVDYSVGLPLYWLIGEGSANVIIGFAILYLNRRR